MLPWATKRMPKRNSASRRRTAMSPPGRLMLIPTPCQLLDFRLLKLAAGEGYSGESGDREILAVILGGKATFEINDRRFEHVGGRPNVFAGKPHSVYIPAGANFTILSEGAVEIALPSAPADGFESQPYIIAPELVANGFWGAANFKRGF